MNCKSKSLKTAWMIIIFLVLLTASGFVYGRKTVTIKADGQTITVHTISADPQRILATAGISLDMPDEYRLSTDKIMDGTTIAVYRAVPIQLVQQGKKKMLIVAAPTVGEAVKALGFVDTNSKVSPNAETPLVAGMTITLVALRHAIVEEEQPVYYQTMRQGDSNLEKDTEKKVQSGANGLKKVTLKRSFADDELVGTEVLGERMLTEAKPEIIAVGSRDTVQTSRGMLRFRDILWMEATAYNPTDGSGEGITATGIAARRGIVAVDPRVIPLGSRLYIPGYGMALAADTGGDVIGNRVDLCMEGYQEAWSFGRRTVKVYVLQ